MSPASVDNHAVQRTGFGDDAINGFRDRLLLGHVGGEGDKLAVEPFRDRLKVFAWCANVERVDPLGAVDEAAFCYPKTNPTVRSSDYFRFLSTHDRKWWHFDNRAPIHTGNDLASKRDLHLHLRCCRWPLTSRSACLCNRTHCMVRCLVCKQNMGVTNNAFFEKLSGAILMEIWIDLSQRGIPNRFTI